MAGAVDTTAGPRTMMVQTAVASRTLSGALPGMSVGQRWSAACSCVQVIARLHSMQVGGFYLRHADGSFDFADVAALQAADLANRLDNPGLGERHLPGPVRSARTAPPRGLVQQPVA